METMTMRRDPMQLLIDTMPPDIKDYCQEHGRWGEGFWELLRRRLTDFPPSTGLPTAPPQPAMRRAAKGTATPKEFFRKPLLRVLHSAADHQMPSQDAIQSVITMVKAELKPADFEGTPGGNVVRVENRIAWCRNDLVSNGLMCKPETVGRGIWKLTERGVREAAKIE